MSRIDDPIIIDNVIYEIDECIDTYRMRGPAGYGYLTKVRAYSWYANVNGQTLGYFPNKHAGESAIAQKIAQVEELGEDPQNIA